MKQTVQLMRPYQRAFFVFDAQAKAGYNIAITQQGAVDSMVHDNRASAYHFTLQPENPF
jgi:hypothetical protein